MRLRLAFLVALLVVPVAAADTLTEDFEDYDLNPICVGCLPETDADQDWYDYSEGAEIGLVSEDDPTINGAQWFRLEANTTTDASARRASFTLQVPAQLIETTFYVDGMPYGADNAGSRQVISIDSSAPVRTMVQFFLLCNDSVNDTGCDFKVRWELADSTGQALVDADAGTTQFKVRIIPDWLDGTYHLFVNDVDDGVFPFLEIPDDIGRLQITQQRAEVPLNMSFDDWTVIGTINGTDSAVEGDIANGLKNFATDIRFTTTGSQFFFGFLVFLVLVAAVLMPLLTLGMDNAVTAATSFFVSLVVLWLVYMEWWPDWVGIALIILVSALVGTLTRRLVLGIKDANQGPGLVAGSLGYFVIATSLLAFSGYATETIAIPTGPAEQQGVNETENPDQSFVGAVAECVFTGGVFTFGLRGDCSQETVSTTWVQITDIFGWVRASFDFLFQLLTFQLPIPIIFSLIIVAPPAAALATFAIQVIRGSGA
jgi:hypothetical protein